MMEAFVGFITGVVFTLIVVGWADEHRKGQR